MPQDDPWAAFPPSSPDAPADPWAQFPVAKGGRKAKARNGGTASTLDGEGVTGTVDGDTLRASSGRSVRLYGVDAPELKQQGVNALGQPVAIGQQSRNALAEITANNGTTFGSPVGESYGRPVAPLSANGLDVGHDLARYGNVLAAPDYLAADPERRFDYMQAERLARENGLGIHGTRFQPPAEFRKAPLPLDQQKDGVAAPDPSAPLGGVQVVGISEDQSEGPLVYDPGHPDANAQGYVRYPNVRITDEMVDLMEARRVYEANATVFQAAKQLLRRALDI